ncbi:MULTISPECIES: DUF1659 domain-containing protein [Clostridium]|uniref:DUF1659 domain-containing protein n=1 Tax=Clostridium TaxID=1485 RepID=UPI000360E26E|nr:MULTISPECIES: DUF1659 domain-containing protein [Clostridium]MBN1037053.1 DUF1659 domain-containing protein [Clostridium botulinum]MBY6932172.1 DUF1659 domain-containing protein [Clostridium botulinum]MCS6131084.1 DUF1659 domain-containing protein [Clostridium botulinum]NFG21660.1 DUF1659 domain-containing protein [Clostridium botulinum]NFI54494.1 DUF1659 domain-containing protein [Clostridium botulinum]
MAKIDELVVGCSLTVEVQNGTDKLGDPIYKKKTFSNVNPTVKSEDLFEVATALENVLSADCRNFFKNNTLKLMNISEN